MGTTLSGTQIRNTYSGILKAGDNAAISSSLKTISDGQGNDTALSLSDSQVKVTNLLIDSPGNSSADEVLVRDSSTGLIGKRRFPNFKSVTLSNGSGTSVNGASDALALTITDSAANTSTASFQSGTNMTLTGSSGTYTYSYGRRALQKITAGVTLAASDYGETLFCDASGSLGGAILTLPEAIEGAFFRVYIDVAGGAFDINAATGDYFYGAVHVDSTSADNHALQTVTRADAAASVSSYNQLTIHAAASTTGGAAGSFLELTCYDAAGWFVTGHLISTNGNPGSIATINGQ